MTMTMRRSVRFGWAAVAAFGISVAAATQSSAIATHGGGQGHAPTGAAKDQMAQLKPSPPPADVSAPGGAAKPHDTSAPKTDLARPVGRSSAAPSPSPNGRGSRDPVDAKGSDRDLNDKVKGRPAKDTHTPEIHMKDLGPVDTRIAVPPAPRRTDERKPNPLVHAPAGPRMRPPQIQPPGRPASRNSIGEALPSPAQPSSRTPARGFPAAGGPAITARRTEGPGSTAAPGNAAPSALQVHPITAPPPSRSMIDGSGMARRSNTPVAIGGQAKPAAGINGSEIRPKH